MTHRIIEIHTKYRRSSKMGDINFAILGAIGIFHGRGNNFFEAVNESCQVY